MDNGHVLYGKILMDSSKMYRVEQGMVILQFIKHIGIWHQENLFLYYVRNHP